MRYFCPNGDEIDSLDEFVNFYEQVYFYAYNKYRLIEKDVERMLESSDGLSSESIETLLEWKTGGEIENGYVKPPYGKSISLKEVNKILLDDSGVQKFKFSGCWTKDKAQIQRLANELVGSFPGYKDGVSGIGPVYALTCLYFLSNGEYPIYDKFAHLGLMAITMDDTFELVEKNGNYATRPKSLLKERQKKFDAQRKGWLDEYYENFYSILIKEGLWDKYREGRSLDRALWAYGHLFGYDPEKAK